MATFVQRLLEAGTIQVGAAAADWESSLRAGGELMVNAGFCEQRYVEAMIRNHKEIGPYFIIAPGIAMPHAKPEEGVLKTGYALLTLTEPVEFGDEENDPVDLLIFAGAANREEHNQEAVPQIAELCDSDEFIEKLRSAKDQAGAEAVLREFEAALLAGELE